MATNWTAIENAIRAWVVTATGLAEGQVIFSDQNAASPAGAYVTIRVGDFVQWGGAAGSRLSYDAGADLREEITHSVERLGELGVSLQAFSADVMGDASARAILEKAQAALDLGTRREALNTAGLGVLDAGRVQWLPKPYGTAQEGRAVLEVRFAMVQTASETTGYIASVQLVDETGE